MADKPKDLTSPEHQKFFAALTEVMKQHGDLGKSFVLAERPAAAEAPPAKTCVLWGIDPNDGSRVCLKWQ